MKKILSSLLVSVALLSVVAPATLAVFSDSASIAGNTISTAQVNISALLEGNNTTLPKPIVASGLTPGQWTSWYRGVVYNEANSTNVRVFMYVTGLTGGACDKTNLKITTGHAGSDAGERANVLYNSIITGISGAGNRIELTGPIFTAPNYLPANTSLVVQQQAQLDSSADNAQANTNCVWTEVFVAETP